MNVFCYPTRAMFVAITAAALAIPAVAAPGNHGAQSAPQASGSARDTRFETHPLVFGKAYEERITPEDLSGPDEEDRHRWSFEGKAGQGVRVDIRSGEFPAMAFLRHKGRVVASSEPAPARAANPQAPGDAFIEYFLPETGTYEVVVRSNAQKGRYTIQAVVGREQPPVWALWPATSREIWGKTSNQGDGNPAQKIYVSGDGAFSFIVPAELQPSYDGSGQVRFATPDNAFRCLLKLNRQSGQTMSNGQLAIRQKLQLLGRVVSGSDIPGVRKNVFNYGITPLAVGAPGEPTQAGFLFAAYDEDDPLDDLGVEPVRAMVDGELLVPITGGDVGVICSAPQASAAWIEGALRGLSIHAPANQ